MKRTLTIIGLVGIGAIALSTTASWKVFENQYHIQKDSKLGTATCIVCHLGKKGGRLNAYGKDLQAVMKAAGTKKLTPELLAKVEGLDSLKDGKTNIAKIKSDTNPGLAEAK
jgi:hypothetical protein